MLIVTFLTLLAATAAAVAVVLLARKVQQHRRLLDRRIDLLADASYHHAEGSDRRLDEMADRLRPLERRRRVDHLLALCGVAERSGRLKPGTSRRVERTLLELYEDVLQEDC
ncbi:MAG: hypothetical protein MPN21_13435 [Thermoanaerobaculia bacterium]|nr:hypothetical protein [Thermoanaerobaculia bacterium]